MALILIICSYGFRTESVRTILISSYGFRTNPYWTPYGIRSELLWVPARTDFVRKHWNELVQNPYGFVLAGWLAGWPACMLE